MRKFSLRPQLACVLTQDSRLRELRASQGIRSKETLCSSTPSRPSPGGPEAQEHETPGGFEGRDDHSSQSTDSASYGFAGDYFNNMSPEHTDAGVSLPPDFNLDQLIFSTPDVLPFDFDSTAMAEPNCAVEVARNAPSFPPEDGIDFSKEALTAEVSKYFWAVYQRYPMWHLDTLLSKIEREEHTTSNEFRSTCLSIYLLNESVLFRKNPHHGSSRLIQIATAIESTRASCNGDHFAECPSTNAVIVSLVLFIAYSVCDRHNLAFYHLNEAAGLLRMIDPSTLDSLDSALYRRLEAILFITESASMLVYGKARKNRMIPCPENLSTLESSMRWYPEQYRPSSVLPSDLANIHLGSLDNKAVNLLYALVSLYNATTAEEISKISISSPAVSEVIEQGVLGNASLQAADVDITRQWQLCLRWQEVLSSRKDKTSSHCAPGAGYTLQIMGLTVLQYSRAIRPGECRIVGHGKLASLATAIFDIASNLGILANCTAVIGDLIRTVYEMDYERYFAPELSLVQLCIEKVPRQITCGEDNLMVEEGQ